MKPRSFDLHVVERLVPDVIILEVGTNDLVDLNPVVVGFQIENLVRLLLESYSARHVSCYSTSQFEAPIFAQRVKILKECLSVVLDYMPNVFCLLRKAFLILLRISELQGRYFESVEYA